MSWTSGRRFEVDLVTLEVGDHSPHGVDAQITTPSEVTRTRNADGRAASAVLAAQLEAATRGSCDRRGRYGHQTSGAIVNERPTGPIKVSACSAGMLKNCTSICTPVSRGSLPSATDVMMP